jgi:hypothetical protein
MKKQKLTLKIFFNEPLVDLLNKKCNLSIYCIREIIIMKDCYSKRICHGY